MPIQFGGRRDTGSVVRDAGAYDASLNSYAAMGILVPGMDTGQMAWAITNLGRSGRTGR